MVSVLAVSMVEGMFDPWPVQIKKDIVVVAVGFTNTYTISAHHH